MHSWMRRSGSIIAFWVKNITKSMPPIIAEKNKLKFAVEFLDTPEALVWVGHGFDPADNDDQRVRHERGQSGGGWKWMRRRAEKGRMKILER